MNTTTKIIVTIVVIVVFIFLFGVIVGVRGDNGNSTPGLFGLIVFAGLIGAIRAIWKKDNNENNDDSAMLQK